MRAEAEQLYRLLETEIVPAFYDRDPVGLPRAWLERVRSPMTRLTPRFSSNRMLSEYVERHYLPAADRARALDAREGEAAVEALALDERSRTGWSSIALGEVGSWAWHVPPPGSA